MKKVIHTLQNPYFRPKCPVHRPVPFSEFYSPRWYWIEPQRRCRYSLHFQHLWLDKDRIALTFIYYVIQSSLALLLGTEGKVGVLDSEDEDVVHHEEYEPVLEQHYAMTIWISHPASCITSMALLTIVEPSRTTVPQE